MALADLPHIRVELQAPTHGRSRTVVSNDRVIFVDGGGNETDISHGVTAVHVHGKVGEIRTLELHLIDVVVAVQDDNTPSDHRET